MSYRNPQIIVDRTAEAYAQASTNLGKTMVKGVEDIYKAQEIEAARIKKENEGYQLVQNNVMLNYNEQQQKAVAGIKDKGLSGQFVNMYEGMLEGKNGAIAAKTALKINGASLPKEERRRLLKIVNDAESFKNVMVNGAGVVIADVEENGKLKPGDFGNGYNWKGQGTGEKFGNMLAYQAIADKTITGITQEKSLDRLDDGAVMMKVNSTIDTNSEFVKSMIEKELFSLDDLEVDAKGFAKLPTWEMDIAKYGDGMIIKTPENIDQAKSLEQAGFVKNGIANKETIGASNVTVEFGKGTKNQSTVSYFDPTNIEGSKALQDMYKNFASGNILSRPLDEQLNYLKDTLEDPYTQKDWANKTPEEQTKIIADRLMEQGVEAVQGSGFKKRKATKDDIKILKDQGIELKGDYVYTRTDKSKSTYTPPDKPIVAEEALENKGKKFYDKVRKDVIGTWEAKTGDKLTIEKVNGNNIITIPEGDKTPKEIFNMSIPSQRKDFYNQLLKVSGKGKGNSKEMRLFREQFEEALSQGTAKKTKSKGASQFNK